MSLGGVALPLPARPMARLMNGRREGGGERKEGGGRRSGK